MDKRIIMFHDTEIEEYKFHQYKSPFLISDIDINKTVVSNKFSFGKQDFKNFIGFKDSEKIRPVYIFRPQMVIEKNNFDENRRIHVLIKEKHFIKYLQILENDSSIIKSKFNSELIYSENYLKTDKKNHKRSPSVFICTNNID